MWFCGIFDYVIRWKILDMYAYEHVVYLYCLKSIGEQCVAGQHPSFGSFGDILFWFIRRHSDSGIGRTSDVHRGDFLGLKTSIRKLMFYSVQSGSVCNSPILWGNTIYTGISIIQLLVFCYVHFVSAYVTYWVLHSCLFLHCKW